MRGVYVKGMVMPKDCLDCPLVKRVLNFSYETVYYCGATEKDISDFEEIDEDCPIVPVPDHGDLIDRDELAHEMWLKFCENCIRAGEDMCNFCTDKQYIDLIVNYPATISAERSEE